MKMENRKYQGRSKEQDFDLRSFNDNHKSWIQKEFDSETIEFAESFGNYLAKNRLTTSQIRNIYGEVKRIEAKLGDGTFGKEPYRDFLLLKPKMAYASKRAGTRGFSELKEVMDKVHVAVTEIENNEQRVECFKNYVDLFEAILAYHKASGGRE